MRIIKPAAITALGLATIITLSDCGTPSNSANDPTRNTKTNSATPTPTIDQKAAVADTLTKFYNHLFNYPAATQKQVLAVVPKEVQSTTSTASLTEAQAKTVKAAMEKADPYFTYLDSSKTTAKNAVTTYIGVLFAASFFKSAGLTVKVSDASIVINGAKATVPSSALKLFKDGKAYNPKTDGGVSISQGTGNGTLNLVNGKWLIDLSKTSSSASASASTN